MKRIFIVFLIGLNSFLYGVSIDIYSALSDVEFLEDTESEDPVYRGRMNNQNIYGIRIRNKAGTDIKFEQNKDYYTSVLIEGTPFMAFSTIEEDIPLDAPPPNNFMKNVVIGLEYNEYSLVDGTYPIDFEQKSMFIGYQLPPKGGRLLFGFVYREDEEVVNQNGNLIVTKEDNIGIIFKINIYEVLAKDQSAEDGGFGMILDNVEAQLTNSTHRLSSEIGVGYKKYNSLIYLKFGISKETKATSSSDERRIGKMMLGFEQTF